MLSGTRLADNAKLLMGIAALERDEQLPVAEEMLLPQGAAPSLQVALKRLFGRDDPKATSPHDMKFGRFVADWHSGDKLLQSEIVAFLRRQGYKITSPRGDA